MVCLEDGTQESEGTIWKLLTRMESQMHEHKYDFEYSNFQNALSK